VKRAPEVCPYWKDGTHGNVLVSVWIGLRRHVVVVCPKCNGWWDDLGLTSARRKRQRRERRMARP
jgi:hypothetical protein